MDPATFVAIISVIIEGITAISYAIPEGGNAAIAEVANNLFVRAEKLRSRISKQRTVNTQAYNQVANLYNRFVNVVNQVDPRVAALVKGQVSGLEQQMNDLSAQASELNDLETKVNSNSTPKQQSATGAFFTGASSPDQYKALGEVDKSLSSIESPVKP